jgi:hypothetical protein
MFTSERENWKAALCLNKKEQKELCQRKSTTDKRKNAYSKLRRVAAEGRGDVNADVDEWEPGVLITSPCDSISVTEG